MDLPDWVEPVARYILEEGLPGTLRVSAFSLVGAVSVGVLLGTLITIRLLPLRAVQSIPREQHEAAAALGFGWVGRHTAVILPQALRRLLPPLVGLLVNIIQNSTLAQVIGGLGILEAAERQNERIAAVPPIGIFEIHAIEIFGFVALLFFIISFPLTRLAAYLE